ncbi:hypothetical protein D3C80_2032050 [compost metagenome]
MQERIKRQLLILRSGGGVIFLPVRCFQVQGVQRDATVRRFLPHLLRAQMGGR